MPVKALKRALKNRRRRNFVRKYISRTVPKTSLLHEILEMTILWKATVLRTGKVLTDERHELTVKRRYPFSCAGCEPLAPKKESVYKNGGLNNGTYHSNAIQ